MTKDEAIAAAESQWWIGLDARDIVSLQLYEDKLMMDFGAFHKATEEALERPVWTHEFAQPKSLQAEFEKTAPPPTFADVLAKLHGHRLRVVVAVLGKEGARRWK